jgi:hypothetical protein
MTLKSEWLRYCHQLSIEYADMWCGARKIIVNRTLSFTTLDDSLQLSDSGYTKSKLTMLTKHYLHHESRNVALSLWEKRKAQGKYGSVGFTTYAHFIKGGAIDAKRSKIASVFGPCIQSVVITLVDKKTYTIDVFYRTTELFKKFPADLVLIRDVLLPGFNFTGLKMLRLNCHFANITMHPMYAIVMLSHSDNVILELESIRKLDSTMWKWVVKWSARYLCPEYLVGIIKFSQAMRVKAYADKIQGLMRKELTRYFRKHMPKKSEVEDDESED